ncbi:hypothetical protein JCM3775_001963 [Rhodotorula graminis]
MPAAAPATTDSWVVTASTSRQPLLPSPVTTPTKRASRSSRISNDTDHRAFTRTSLDPATGLESSVEFRIGDTVVVNELAKLKQKFLAPPPYLVPRKTASRTKAKGKAKATVTPDDDDEAEDEDNWRHEDGLRAGDKVAVITRLFEDVRGRKMAMVRWFARPGAVWGEQGPDEDHDEFGEVMPYELYFTSDSTYLQESRLLRQKAAANPFSSPSSSSPTKRRGTTSSSRGASSSSFLSSAASFRTPLHSDAVPISTIASSAEVFSPSALGDTPITAQQQRSVPMFVCTRVYDVKPVAGAGFWGEVEWDEKRRAAVEWYEDKMRDGERDVAQDKWDVEPVMEAGSSEDEVDEDEEREKEERRRARVEKAKAAKERKERERAQKGGASADESSDDEEDTFANSDASSSSSDDSDDSSSDSDERSSDDDDDVLRTPTKPKARSARQLPTPASSSASSRRASTVTKAKRARPSTTADSGRQAKRRRFAAKSRTTKGSTTTAAASPTSANALPPLLDARELAKLSPFDRAKALLHVSATPESLPCRDEQRERIRQFLGDAILGRTGGCLYVHGVPGTGKTATVHSVVRELQKDEDMDAFTFVEINGMKISEPMAAFSHLWSALAPSSTSSSSSHASTPPRKTSPKAALAALEHHFANPDPARPTTVVLVDELDQMLTKRQDVLYNFFNWPHVAHSRLVVVAVANTMDLPERELSGKIRSRLGTNRIPFQPYTWAELKRILEARLALVALPSSSTSTSSPPPPPLFDDVALQKIAKSVAGISGDARKALDVARRTLDRVALRLAASPSSGAAGSTAPVVRCTIQDATAAYNDMTRTGPATFVRRQSTHAKVLLLAVAQCAKRAGVPDVELDTVLAWHGDFVRQAALVDARALYPASRSELVGVVAQLHAQRLVATESQRLDVFQRVRACVDEGDLFAALREDEVLKAHVPKVL